MKKRMILTSTFVISLLPMLLNQYGGRKGVQEISGLGVIGIVISEIIQFLIWHVSTITGEISIHHSIRFAFPEFYFGLIVSVLMVCIYFVIERLICVGKGGCENDLE